MAWVLVLIIGVMTIVFKTSTSWVFYESKEGK